MDDTTIIPEIIKKDHTKKMLVMKAFVTNNS